jgi:hypothetical protein
VDGLTRLCALNRRHVHRLLHFIFPIDSAPWPSNRHPRQVHLVHLNQEKSTPCPDGPDIESGSRCARATQKQHRSNRGLPGKLGSFFQNPELQSGPPCTSTNERSEFLCDLGGSASDVLNLPPPALSRPAASAWVEAFTRCSIFSSQWIQHRSPPVAVQADPERGRYRQKRSIQPRI